MAVSLDRLSVFHTVVESGSFAAAARRLRQTRTAVSFQIRQLEAELGVVLLHRTTRSLALTAAGERFHARCMGILAEADAAVSEARSEQSGLSGTLRITSTVEYGAAVVAPALARFAIAHPCLDVELEAGSSNIDLLRDRFDVAMRLGRDEQFSNSPYVGTLLGTYRLRLVGSPAMVGGEPMEPGMPAPWPHVTHATVEGVKRWTMHDSSGREHLYEEPETRRIVANSASVIKALVIGGAGVALLPDWFVSTELESGKLVDMLPAYRLPLHSIHAMHLRMEIIPRKITAWIDWLRHGSAV